MSEPHPDCVRRRAPDERPHQILEAALDVFDEQGLAGARLDDIAKRAGVAKGTIYLYFPNKEALFREVICQTLIHRLDAARGEMDAVAATTRPVEQLRAYVRGWWSFLITPKHQAVYRLIVGELHHFPELTEFYRDEVVTRAHGLVASVIARGIEAGEFRPIDPRVASRLMGSMLVSHALWLRRHRLFTDADQLEADAVCEQVLDFILHALRPVDGPPGARHASA